MACILVFASDFDVERTPLTLILLVRPSHSRPDGQLNRESFLGAAE